MKDIHEHLENNYKIEMPVKNFRKLVLSTGGNLWKPPIQTFITTGGQTKGNNEKKIYKVQEIN